MNDLTVEQVAALAHAHRQLRPEVVAMVERALSPVDRECSPRSRWFGALGRLLKINRN